MTNPLSGAEGFWCYAEWRRAGKTDEEIAAEVTAKEKADFEARSAKVRALFEAGLKARSEEGEKFVRAMETAPDITKPARERIAAAMENHDRLNEEADKWTAQLEDGIRRMRENGVRKAELERELAALRNQLDSMTGEPAWMKKGTLEELRKAGGEYGRACARR